jgi:hypothetical protein
MNGMDERQPLELSHAQLRTLQRLLANGFELVPMERLTRQVVVERNRFVALLDPSGGKLKVYGQVGYRIGEGIGMLVTRGCRQAFVWKHEGVPATPQLMEEYARVKKELAEILEERQ